MEAVSSAPRAAIWPTTRVATSAEVSCRPWSTVTPMTGQGSSRASKTAAASRASESAPPEQATRTGAEPGSPRARSRRTASRVAATAGSGPVTGTNSGHPRGGIGDLGLGGQVGGVLPDDVEVGHPDLVDDPADERRAVAVLRHLGVEAEQAAQHLVEHADALTAAGELLADVLDRRDHAGSDAVHHDVGVALEQGHHAGQVVHDLALLGRADDVEQAAALRPALERLGEPLEAVVEEPGRLDRLGEPADLLVEVVAHPRDRGELHAVGLLVQAHPEPEVVRVGAQLALDVHDVGGDEQQPAGRGRGTGRTGRAPCRRGSPARPRSRPR